MKFDKIIFHPTLSLKLNDLRIKVKHPEFAETAVRHKTDSNHLTDGHLVLFLSPAKALTLWGNPQPLTYLTLPKITYQKLLWKYEETLRLGLSDLILKF